MSPDLKIFSVKKASRADIFAHHQTTDEFVKNHLDASKKVMATLKQSPKKRRAFLIAVGVLNKSGTGPGKLCK